MTDISLPSPPAARRGRFGPSTSRPSAGRRSPARLAGSLLRGREQDPPWVRPALLAVLALAALLCAWGLTRDGMSNEYYAAAVRSASVSWKAWFFGSLDPGSFITVDKPPLSLWMMGLSARVFGFSSFSMLLPNALCAVAAVALLYRTVRRTFGPAAATLSAAGLALTPVSVAVARVNNPDSLLVLLLVAAAALLMAAIESGRTRHLVWCGVVVGLAFMTKMLEGWMIVPALAVAYLRAGRRPLPTRLRQLAAAGAAMTAVSAAWPLAVTLWPGSTPYIGGSTNGSVWNLILGYNGFGRLTGNGTGLGGGASFGGSPGLARLFDAQVGGQIAWLLPLAATGLVAGLWFSRRAPRTDHRRAAWLLFGLWALVDAVVFSSQKGIFHPYYVSAMAPAVAVLAGTGALTLWRRSRTSWAALAVLDGALLASAALAVVLLGRTPAYAAALRVLIPAAAAVAVAASVVIRSRRRGSRAALVALLAAGAIAVGAGPAAYSLASVGRALDGNNVLAGPATVSNGFGPGAAPGTGAARGFGRPPAGARTGGPPAGGPPAGATAGMGAGATRGTAGSLAMGAGGGSVSTTALRYLEAHQGSARYLVAATGSQTTAPIIVQTGRAVVTIGGFSGNDPAPTVSELARMVAGGQLRYVLLSSGGGGGPGGGNQALSAWVKAHGTAVTGLGIGNSTLYRVSA